MEESREFEALLESVLEITTLGTADEPEAEVSTGSTTDEERGRFALTEQLAPDMAGLTLAGLPLIEGLLMVEISLSKSSSESEDLMEESLITLVLDI